MKLSPLIVFSALCISGAAFADAPFCLVTSYGTNCWYYNANDCRRQAESQGGMCVTNTAQPQQNPVLNSFKSISEAGDAGARMGMERREHEERMKLLQAQTKAATGPSVTYMCLAADNTPFLTQTPYVGCTVSAIGQ